MAIPYIFWGFMIFCILLSALLALVAIINNQWWLMIISAITFFPFVGYFNGYPRFEGSLFILLFHVVAIFAIIFKKYRIAWISLVPALIFTLWILAIVIVNMD